MKTGVVAVSVMSAVLFALMVCKWLLSGIGDPRNPKLASSRSQDALHAVHDSKSRIAQTFKSAAKHSRGNSVLDSDDEDESDGISLADRELANRIERAYDEENLRSALLCVKDAQKSTDPNIRQSMVDTLGWFGGEALPELLPFLADPDEDVRDSARSHMAMGLSDLESERNRIDVVERIMGVLDDEDFLSDMSDEYIGIDEKLAVESLVRVIEGGGSKEGIARAKETYEFVTGEQWSDAAAARRWIAEEYEPPEEGI